MKRLWFRRKRYGYGWTPCTWQGWLVTFGFVGAIGFVAVTYTELLKFVVNDTRGILSLTAVMLVAQATLVGVLIWVCYKTGESPKWSWGESKEGNE